MALEPWLEAVRFEPAIPDRRSVSQGGRYVTVIVDGRVAVPATLRLRCALSGTECLAGGLAFAAGTEIPVRIAGSHLLFAVDHLEGAGTTALTPGKSVDVLTRFVVAPFVERLMAAGDRDRPAETAPSPVAAQIVRIVKTQTVSGQTTFEASSNGTTLSVPSSLRQVDAVIRVPAQLDGTSTYRRHRMAAGAPLEFETDRYAVAGRIVSVSPGGERR